jgi:hypothetical protein
MGLIPHQLAIMKTFYLISTNFPRSLSHIQQCLPALAQTIKPAKTGDLVGGVALCRFYHSDRSWLQRPAKRHEKAN